MVFENTNVLEKTRGETEPKRTKTWLEINSPLDYDFFFFFDRFKAHTLLDLF